MGAERDTARPHAEESFVPSTPPSLETFDFDKLISVRFSQSWIFAENVLSVFFMGEAMRGEAQVRDFGGCWTRQRRRRR